MNSNQTKNKKKITQWKKQLTKAEQTQGMKSSFVLGSKYVLFQLTYEFINLGLVTQ